jgi:hypothetical protein
MQEGKDEAEAEGPLVWSPIIVDSDLQIIDGVHRVMAAKEKDPEEDEELNDDFEYEDPELDEEFEEFEEQEDEDEDDEL